MAFVRTPELKQARWWRTAGQWINYLERKGSAVETAYPDSLPISQEEFDELFGDLPHDGEG